MKKVFCLFAVLLLLLAGCAEKQQSVVIADDDGESGTVTVASLSDIRSAETMDEAQITCKPLYNKDGDHHGFEMRLPKTDALDAMLSDPANLYFGFAANGKCCVSVPMESVRVLADNDTHEFVVTLLIPVGELTGSGCTVFFYVSPRGDESNALFCAQKDVENY